MEDFFADSLCLKAQDFRESDKIVSLYCGGRGKISVVAKGCKTQKAKLKFACSPFCFGKYYINGSEKKYILTGCDVYDGFYSLTQDLDKYYAASVALEIVDKLTLENDYNHDLFVVTLKYLKELCYGKDEKQDAKFLLQLYLRRAIAFLGYEDVNMNLKEQNMFILETFDTEIKSLKYFLDN